jgi:hypothetical protein
MPKINSMINSIVKLYIGPLIVRGITLGYSDVYDVHSVSLANMEPYFNMGPNLTIGPEVVIQTLLHKELQKKRYTDPDTAKKAVLEFFSINGISEGQVSVTIR